MFVDGYVVFLCSCVFCRTRFSRRF